MSAIAAVDTETLGLDPERHAVWEIGIILRAGCTETEHLWQIRPTRRQLRRADAKALDINGFRERFAVPRGAQAADMLAPGGPKPMTRNQVRAAINAMLTKAVMVGSNPAFDASFLRVFLGSAPWHYRVVDFATLAAGYLHGKGEQVDLPYSSRELSRAVGVQPPGKDGHQALVDARWALAGFDAAGGPQQLEDVA